MCIDGEDFCDFILFTFCVPEGLKGGSCYSCTAYLSSTEEPPRQEANLKEQEGKNKTEQ